jgi:hypothetical protein
MWRAADRLCPFVNKRDYFISSLHAKDNKNSPTEQSTLPSLLTYLRTY